MKLKNLLSVICITFICSCSTYAGVGEGISDVGTLSSLILQDHVEITEIIVNSFEIYYPQLNQFPESIYLEDQITIKGQILDINNLPVPGSQVGIEDGLALFSSSVTANENGEFEYTNTVNGLETHCSRNVLFTLPFGNKYKLLAFNVSVPTEMDLLSTTKLISYITAFNNSHNFSIEDLTPYNESGTPFWVGSDYISNLLSIDDFTDVNELNYFHIIQQYDMQQTDPFINDPFIYQRALDIRTEVHKQAAIELIDNYSPGLLKTFIYVGEGLWCATTLAGNPIGPIGCALLVKTITSDLIKGTVLSVMEIVGIDESIRTKVSIGWELSNVFYNPGAIERLTSFTDITDELYLKIQLEDILDVLMLVMKVT